MSNTIWIGKIERDLIKNISDIAWDDHNLSLVQIIDRIRGYLYEYEQIVDHASLEEERLYRVMDQEIQKQEQ